MRGWRPDIFTIVLKDITHKQLISTIIQHFLIMLTCVNLIIGSFLIRGTALLKGLFQTQITARQMYSNLLIRSNRSLTTKSIFPR